MSVAGAELIVLDDVDLEQAVGTAAWGSFFYQGQICMAIGRHLVHDSIYPEYVERLAPSSMPPSATRSTTW